jgi:hypothetical protein
MRPVEGAPTEPSEMADATSEDVFARMQEMLVVRGELDRSIGSMLRVLKGRGFLPEDFHLDIDSSEDEGAAEAHASCSAASSSRDTA